MPGTGTGRVGINATRIKMTLKNKRKMGRALLFAKRTAALSACLGRENDGNAGKIASKHNKMTHRSEYGLSGSNGALS